MELDVGTIAVLSVWVAICVLDTHDDPIYRFVGKRVVSALSADRYPSESPGRPQIFVVSVVGLLTIVASFSLLLLPGWIFA